MADVTIPDTPMTRTEQYLAAANGQSVTLPTPLTREEIYLNEIATKMQGGGGSSVTVEPLSVTANGEYTAPSGKAYSPVTVDVQPPEPAPPKDVNFIDFDGTIVYSYTSEEFLALTEMPPNPDHTADGLTAQGWNWSLAGAKEYVSEMKTLDIGQQYITDDGKTRVYIRLLKPRLSPYLGFAINGTATVDWGDNTVPSTVVGTDLKTPVLTQHTYAEEGDYVISITVSGQASSFGTDTTRSTLLCANSSVRDENIVYQAAIRKVEFGESMTLGSNAFCNCKNMRSVTIPQGALDALTNVFNGTGSIHAVVLPLCDPHISQSYAFINSAISTVSLPYGLIPIGNQMFSQCAALRRISTSTSVAQMPTSFVNGCFSLANLTIPKSVNYINGSALVGLRGLGSIHFLSSTPPTIDASSYIQTWPTDCKIYVPSGSLAAYTSATNYPDPTIFTYVEE